MNDNKVISLNQRRKGVAGLVPFPEHGRLDFQTKTEVIERFYRLAEDQGRGASDTFEQAVAALERELKQ